MSKQIRLLLKTDPIMLLVIWILKKNFNAFYLGRFKIKLLNKEFLTRSNCLFRF